MRGQRVWVRVVTGNGKAQPSLCDAHRAAALVRCGQAVWLSLQPPTLRLTGKAP